MTIKELFESLGETLTNNPELADRHVFLQPDADNDYFYDIIDIEVDEDGDLIIIGED